MENVGTRAAALTRKRNLDGTPINPKSNSFDALSNKQLMLRAAKLVVIIPDDDFACVEIIMELEKTRMNNDIDIPVAVDANVNSTL